jgi:quercetin dioxygenase-like cupin family protein
MADVLHKVRKQKCAHMSFIFHRSVKSNSPILVPEIGLSLQIRVPGEATGGVLTAIETINAPGKGPPLHRHPEAEIFYVLQGHYLFEVDGQRFESREGDVVTVPGGAVHAFVNVGSSPARQFIQILPALDAASFFTGLAEIMRDGKPDKAALDQFGKKWRVDFLGPPLEAPR